MRKQARELAVPIKDYPIIKVMLRRNCEGACNEGQFDKLIYSNPINEYFDFRFQRDEGVLSTVWHSVPAAGERPSHHAVYRCQVDQGAAKRRIVQKSNLLTP